VPGIADLNASRIKQWFEYANLVRTSDPRPGLTPATDPLKVLKQLGDEHRFNNELTRAMQPGNRSQAGEESPAAKLPSAESLLQLVRDGIKLVEQSLSQNLLQRASLGMQQETQQPLSLSFALPFLEQQEVKPLQIKLAQRDQQQQERENGWDIRLSFEFSGLGLISCHLFLESSTVAASFYSEQEQTRHRIEQALPQLRQQLTDAGFIPGDFHSFVGEPTQKNSISASAYSESLIDIEV
jgi:flagellar hook-length control protein FliK